jgi:hypothetical protein
MFTQVWAISRSLSLKPPSRSIRWRMLPLFRNIHCLRVQLIRFITLNHYIKNVPVISCPRCGESCLTAETLHEIERIKLHRQSFAELRQVAVAEFT